MDCIAHQNPLSMEILQARMLEWGATPFSRGSSQSRNWTWVSCTAGRFFTVWASREVPKEGLLPRHSFQFNSSYMDYIPTRWKTLLQAKNEFKNKPAARGTWLGVFSKLLQLQRGMCLKKKKKDHLLHINVTTTFNKSKYPPIPVLIPHIYHLPSANTTMTPFRK